MSRMCAAVALSLVLFSTANVAAGPPDERSSAMQLDRVADGLRQYQQSKTDKKRVAWLRRLAPSRDPRVEAVLEAARSDSSEVVAEAAGYLLVHHYGHRLRFQRHTDTDPPPLPPSSGPPET